MLGAGCLVVMTAFAVRLLLSGACVAHAAAAPGGVVGAVAAGAGVVYLLFLAALVTSRPATGAHAGGPAQTSR